MPKMPEPQPPAWAVEEGDDPMPPSDSPTLDQLEEMERKATPGPWRRYISKREARRAAKASTEPNALIAVGDKPYTVLFATPGNHDEKVRDAANETLAVALRNAAPGLLRLWRAAKELDEFLREPAINSTGKASAARVAERLRRCEAAH